MALRSNQMFNSDTCVTEHEFSDGADSGAPPTAPHSEILVEFLPADALELGLDGTTMPMERLLYLLDGNVLEEDRKMAELVDRISARYGDEYKD